MKKTNTFIEFLRKNLFLGAIGLFIFIPLYPKFPLISVGGTYVAIRMEDFLIALVSLWWFIAILPEIKSLLSKKIVQAILLFWLIGGLSLFSGVFLTHTVSFSLGIFHYLRRVETMVLLLVALSAFTNENQVRIWLYVMLVTTIIVVAYGFGQQWLKFPVISTTNREFSKGLILFLSPEARVNSTFAGHYDLAAYLAFFLSVVTAMFFYGRKLWQKLSLLVVSFFSFILLAMTAARVSFVAAILAIGAAFVMIGQKKLIFLLLGVTLLGFVISPDLRHRTIATLTVNILGGGGAKYTPPPPKPNADPNKFSLENAATKSATLAGAPIDVAPGEPVNSTELGVYRSYGIRLDVEWPRAIRALEKNLFLGTGYSSITIATDNDYLRSLGETGLLGTASLFLVFFLIVKKMVLFVWKKKKSFETYLIIGLLCGLLTYFITALFIDVLESSKIAQMLWLTLGVGLALIKMEHSDG